MCKAETEYSLRRSRTLEWKFFLFRVFLLFLYLDKTAPVVSAGRNGILYLEFENLGHTQAHTFMLCSLDMFITRVRTQNDENYELSVSTLLIIF